MVYCMVKYHYPGDSIQGQNWYGGRTFIHAAAGLWNALPGDVRTMTNLQTFKKHLKSEQSSGRLQRYFTPFIGVMSTQGLIN